MTGIAVIRTGWAWRGQKFTSIQSLILRVLASCFGASGMSTLSVIPNTL